MGKFAQQTGSWCGPASLQYALNKFGKRIGQKKLAKRAKTTMAGGTAAKDMKRVVKEEGFKTKIHQGGSGKKTLKKLNKVVKKGGTAIVDYLVGPNVKEDGHYSVLEKATKKKVHLWDPAEGKKRTVPVKKFIKSWKDIGDKGGISKKWALEMKKRK